MKILPSNVVPVFMPGAGIGNDFGLIGPQIRYFDVYYINPPVVGFSVAVPPAEEIP